MRILIVDNNVELCQALKQYFDHQQDLEVAGIAHDGEDALAQIEALEPDVMLLDITMPYLDGLGVLERMQSLKVKTKPKVVVITAFGTDNLQGRLMALGAHYFMVKPFRVEILAQRVREFAGGFAKVVLCEEAFSQETMLAPEQRVIQLLHLMGIPPHLKGFPYLKDVVLMCLAEGYLAGGLSKEVYPALAKKYRTTIGGVEAAIRNAIAAAWEYGNRAYIEQLCQPYCSERMPTNSLLIAKITETSHGT